MVKRLCDWCSEKEYDIAVPRGSGEEFLCKECFEEYLLLQEEE
jgi:hypothetical protein